MSAERKELQRSTTASPFGRGPMAGLGVPVQKARDFTPFGVRARFMPEHQSAFAPFRHHRAAQPGGRVRIVIARDPDEMRGGCQACQQGALVRSQPLGGIRIVKGIAQRDYVGRLVAPDRGGKRRKRRGRIIGRQHHAARRVRVLATSGPTRSAYLPDVPSFVEAGHPDLVVKEWFAFFAPGATPKDTVASLAATLQNAIARPELSAAFALAGMTAASSSPAALSARIAVEQQYWRPVLRAHGIRAEL